MNVIRAFCFGAFVAMAGSANAGEVLFFHFGPSVDNYAVYGNKIASFIDQVPDANVTVRAMANAEYNDLATFDQIWVYDLNNGGYNANANVLANSENVAAWYNARVTSGVGDNLILDGRILSSAAGANEVGLIQSFYNNMNDAGGGLFLGTDHCPQWCSGINYINDLIDIGNFTGFYSAQYAILDTESPLADGVPCSVVISGNCMIYSNTTTGFAPAGLQANGQFLTPLAYNTTNPNAILTEAYELTAISSTFGSQTFGTVPAPASFWLLGLGLALLRLSRR
ncbi:MAG: hypothetical protein ACFHX7_25260 [Pseudomonadota bacterium]